MTRRLVKRVATPPPHYVPPTRRYEPPPPRRNKLRTARVIVFEHHVEFSLLGFEIEHLDNLKECCAMRWDRSDKVWVVDRRDVRYLLEALEGNDFIIRMKHADPADE